MFATCGIDPGFPKCGLLKTSGRELICGMMQVNSLNSNIPLFSWVL